MTQLRNQIVKSKGNIVVQFLKVYVTFLSQWVLTLQEGKAQNLIISKPFSDSTQLWFSLKSCNNFVPSRLWPVQPCVPAWQPCHWLPHLLLSPSGTCSIAQMCFGINRKCISLFGLLPVPLHTFLLKPFSSCGNVRGAPGLLPWTVLLTIEWGYLGGSFTRWRKQ